MALTRSYKELVLNDIKSDPAFAAALFQEAVTAVFNGELSFALTTLRDIVNVGMGFQALSRAVGMTAQNLHRVLCEKGNPTVKTLGKIITAIGEHSGFEKPVFAVAS